MMSFATHLADQLAQLAAELHDANATQVADTKLLLADNPVIALRGNVSGLTELSPENAVCLKDTNYSLLSTICYLSLRARFIPSW
jgi:phosphopantothenate synthetase